MNVNLVVDAQSVKPLNTVSGSGNVVVMADHIAWLRSEGKIQRRGFFFTYDPEGASVVDLIDYRLRRLQERYS